MERKHGSGRSRKSTVRQDRQMLKMVKVDPRKMAVDVTNYANKQLEVSNSPL